MESLLNWLVPSQFMPHGHCYLWTPSLLWTYVTSDVLIALSYYSIPGALIYFIRRRPDLDFNWVFPMFSLFIFACGTTHLIAIATIWEPMYWLDATVKGFTAFASVITAIMLWRLMPIALTITSNNQLKNTIKKLERAIEQQHSAESALEEMNIDLESMVELRTNELMLINVSLRREIEQREFAEQELLKQKTQAEITLQSIGDGVITTNMQAEIVYLNPVAEKMTGWTKADAIGRPILEVFRVLNESTRKLVPNPIDVVLVHNEVCGLANHTLLVSKTGEEFAIEDTAAPIRDIHGVMHGVVLVFHDVSDAKNMAQKMTYLAEHDFLTDLPNRLLFTDRVTQALSAAKRKRTKAAILFFDVDHFKKVNDSLGHDVGDQLLKLLSYQLKLCLRGSDTISRQGGDEFIILLPEIKDGFVAAEIAQKILETTKKPLMINEHEIFVSGSVGIAIYPDDANNVDDLIKNADAAMYHAKNSGRNNFQFFTQQMSERVAIQLSLENNLKRAIANQEFVLYYQPKLSIQTGEIVSAEALIRWRNPGLGLVMPDRFIPVAEDSGLIKSIGEWVLFSVCNQIRAWQDASLSLIPVAINVSAVELRQTGYMQQVAKILLQTGVSPEFLELEVTERIAIEGHAEGIKDLTELNELGIKISVDDFGTGYSSLSYLKRLPISTIKIDKSFIRDINIDANDEAIVIAIIKMAQSLGLKVIAEGVETQQQLDFLKRYDCDEAQGYLFSPPVSAEAFAKLLQNK